MSDDSGHPVELRGVSSEHAFAPCPIPSDCGQSLPNIASLLRLITARLYEISDSWESGKVYLNMNPKSQSLAAGPTSPPRLN